MDQTISSSWKNVLTFFGFKRDLGLAVAFDASNITSRFEYRSIILKKLL